MKYYDNSLCSVTSLVVYRCVIFISNQPKYLVGYDIEKKTTLKKDVLDPVIFKVLSKEII